MPHDSTLAIQDRVRELEGELRLLKARLGQREDALTALNRRLLEFERGQGSLNAHRPVQVGALVNGSADISDEAQLHVLRERARVAEEELAAMRSTKVFRWSRTPRRVYALFRGQP